MTTPRVQREERPKDALRNGIVKYEFSKNYLYNMKYEQGILTEADIKARRRFWNKREVIVRCNCPGAYTNVTGHKTITVPVDKIILLSDY